MEENLETTLLGKNNDYMGLVFSTLDIALGVSFSTFEKGEHLLTIDLILLHICIYIRSRTYGN